MTHPRRASFLAIAIAFLFISVPMSFAQRETLNLGGEWQSSLGMCILPGTTDENKLGGGQHATDVTTQLTRIYPYYGKVTFERKVDIPRSMEGKRLTLVMERTKPSTLWVDGELIGSICQLYAPHVYVLPALKAGSHSIKIEIDNSEEVVPKGIRGTHAWTDATQTNWNGILGKFCIEATPSTFIQNVQTYPDLEKEGVLVKVKVIAEKSCKAKLAFICQSQSTTKVTLHKGENIVEQFIQLGPDVQTWSEFHPALYDLSVCLKSKEGADIRNTTFGMRHFTTEGTQIVINGKKTFFRGTHDACVFPLTGYAPTDVDQWRKMFQIAKEYGINHYRFHSYTPPEAAFTAADIERIYLHTELPLWGTIDSTTTDHNDFLRHEAFTVLEQFGNHPSFVGLGLGNELWGDHALMASWLADFRKVDDRHLYAMGSNNTLGWHGPQPGEDLNITCRIGTTNNPDFNEDWAIELNEAGYGTHARTSFSFSDADQGGILNVMRPGTHRSFANVVPLSKAPIISHETCQFQIYPDYTDLPKYTGVLYPYNHEIFRERLKENGLTGQIEDFHRSTGLWAIECYKADMEYCLRTPGFGGYQLLDIKDYPGQGTALVGILDAFMETKGLISPEEFRQFNSPVVPMAKMKTYCWSSDQTLDIECVISNYEESDFRSPLQWTISSDQLNEYGAFENAFTTQGDVASVGRIRLSLASITHPQKLELKLRTGKYSNSYDLWVYPADSKASGQDSIFTMADSLDAATIENLVAGGTVLLTPRHASIEKQSVGGLFTPDYWNYAMFKTISENNKRPVSPGTLGMLMDKDHPFFGNFPTDGHSNWQWWCIALNSRPLILDSLPHGYLPLIQTVDNVERNHKLGILMEFKVGAGKLMVCTTDLQAISCYPEGRWYQKAIRSYIGSEDFNPKSEVSVQDLIRMLYSSVEERDIQGVENITSYAH